MSIGKIVMSGLALKITACAACVALMLLGSLAHAAPPHRCASAATEQAAKLLAFHFGPDDRIEVDKSVMELAPIRNPANRKQLLDVLQVWGHIYKGQYRMRFIYARMSGECLLMGQEILEYADL
ncbi:MAG: hypothetical protein WBO88_10780 [Candidatus Dechloromonas phosphoritropha]|nr:hypothetical protein [Azonexus sp.]MBP9228967.1 hypothetical protein [Azonexus sp.]